MTFLKKANVTEYYPVTQLRETKQDSFHSFEAVSDTNAHNVSNNNSSQEVIQ